MYTQNNKSCSQSNINELLSIKYDEILLSKENISYELDEMNNVDKKELIIMPNVKNITDNEIKSCESS